MHLEPRWAWAAGCLSDSSAAGGIQLRQNKQAGAELLVSSLFVVPGSAVKGTCRLPCFYFVPLPSYAPWLVSSAPLRLAVWC